MCRASGRGCTVIPWHPAAMQVRAASTTLGIFPPRAFRSVAILLTLTLRRIVIEPSIHHGEPCIKGTRVPVSVFVASIADGDTPQQIIDAWPQLTGVDIKAALKFAAEAVNNADFVPLQRTNGR